MTAGILDYWCRRATEAEAAATAARKDQARTAKKSAKQRDAIRRLERRIEILKAEKSALSFDLHKLRARDG